MEAVQKIATAEALELAKALNSTRLINIMRAGDESEDEYYVRINTAICQLGDLITRTENNARLLTAIKAAAVACALNAGAPAT